MRPPDPITPKTIHISDGITPDQPRPAPRSVSAPAGGGGHRIGPRSLSRRMVARKGSSRPLVT